jgi:hypothetical protein
MRTDSSAQQFVAIADSQADVGADAAIGRFDRHSLDGKQDRQAWESTEFLQAQARHQAHILAARLAADANETWDRVPMSAVGAWDFSGKPLYAYPEIAGYWLQWAAPRNELDDRAILNLLEWLRSAQCASGRWPTRVGLTQAVPASYLQRVFFFDHAMLRRGIAAAQQWRELPLAQELLDALDADISSWQVQGSFQACIPGPEPESSRWSQLNGAFLLKARAALHPLNQWREALARAFPFDAALRCPHPQAHPQLYAIEGLIALGDLPTARTAWSELRRQFGGDGKLIESTGGKGPLRSDVLAQVLRIALVLDGHAEVCASPGLTQVCAQLISRIEGERMPFAPGSAPAAWSAIFAAQALHAFGQGGWRLHEEII